MYRIEKMDHQDENYTNHCVPNVILLVTTYPKTNAEVCTVLYCATNPIFLNHSNN